MIYMSCAIFSACFASQENSCCVFSQQLDILQVSFWPISRNNITKNAIALFFFQIARNIMPRYPSRRLALETTTAAAAATNNSKRSNRQISLQNNESESRSSILALFCSTVGANEWCSNGFRWQGFNFFQPRLLH